ncbi:proline-rich receptor-like protein kinase PERK10 [Lathyrus oleraceus]|uniref:proline-rich receptor-like protein kinase PERK10 n=1 Tax=Pisum sativum TaxID=3888 RepID=UPI0021CEA5D5|nr:proline-rich receptor-like protein kinase PERK10 [Pisum sativum]
MKRHREASRKSKKAKLGETSRSRPPVPLADSPSNSLPPSRSIKLKPIASSLPQTTPIYTQSETPPSTTRPSNLPSLKFNLATTTLPISEAEMLNETTSPSSSLPSSPPYYILSSDNEPSDPQSLTLAQLQAHALTSQQPPQPEPEVTSPFSEQHNPPPSDQPQTPPHEQQTNPPSEQPQTPPPEQPTTAPSELPPSPPPEQATLPPSDIPPLPTSEDIIPTQTPADTNPTPPSSPSSNPEPKTAFPTLEEAITLFAESSVEKIKSLSVNFGISDDPSIVRIHWNRVIIWMTSEAFKLKVLSEHVRNDFVRDAGVRLQTRLVREAEEKARKKAEEKTRLAEEKRIREAEEKAATEVAAAAIAEAKAKAKVEAEEAEHIAVEEAAKASPDALNQGEQFNSGFAPLVLKTLEELQKEQQVFFPYI